MRFRFHHSKRLHRLLAAVVVLLGLGCRGKARRTPPDTLVVIVDSVLRDLDPRFSLTNHDVKLSRLIAPGLTTADTPDLSPQMLLAESIEEVAPLRYRARLRDGIRFSDGTPVRASDVAFTYNSVLSPETESVYRKSFTERFRSVEIVNEREVDFVLHKPIATLLSDLEFGILSESAAAESRVIGAGAFQIETFAPEHVVLRKNPNFGEPAKIERIEVKTVRDGNARNLMLVGGSADFSQNAVRVDLVDVMAERERVELVSGKSAILTYLMMHNEDPILSDLRVRKAIALALDRKRIVEAKYGGHAQLATGLLPTFHWAYNGNVHRYERDVERAKKLLDEAGYPDPDGPGGRPRMRLSYKTSASQFRLAVARVIAAQLEEVGIVIEVQSFEFGTFFADVKQGNYQLASMQTSAISEPDFYYTYFHSSRIPSPEQPHLHNRWRYRNSEIDRLTEMGRQTMDREARFAAYARVQEVLADELPIVPLWHEDNIAIVNRSVRDYQVVPNARYVHWGKVHKE